MARREIEDLNQKIDRVARVSERIEVLLPDLEELVRFRMNLDRLGPRLDLIDQLGVLLPRLYELANMVGVMNDVGAVLRRFLDANHEVSETVRVDVETISALGLQIEKSLAEVLAELRKSNGS